VLFVHGGVGDYRAWDQQMNAFGAGYRAIALSCRGYWPNPKLRPGESITLDTFVDDLAQFVQALDAGPVHLVGHSSPGGFGGLRLASQHPELLRTLVLLEPPAFPLLGVSIPPRPAQVIKLLIRHPRAGIGFIKFGAKGMGPAIKAFERGDDAGALRIFMAANSSHAVVEGIPEAMFQRFVDNAGPLKAQIKAGFPPFAASDARAIRVPTLLVSGAESPAHIKAVTDRLAKLVPNADRLTIAGATHNMFNSHPAEFNAGVLRFIRSHSAADR
jgi:pimeloyl-ACP methyl ester carboxylesterase